MNKSNTKNLAAPLQKIPDAATVTGWSQYALRKGVQNGTVPHIRSGRTIYINVPKLMEKINAES